MSELRANHLVPLPSRLSPRSPQFAATMAAHDAAVGANRPGYLDPATRLFAFTAAELAKRPCCGSGCRHCPWATDETTR